MTPDQLGDAPDQLGDAALSLAAELVAIDSVNPGLVPGAAGESEIVRHLAKRLSGNGFATRVVEAVEPGRPSLVAWPAAMAPSSVRVILNGHVDTVGVCGMAEPFTPRVEGGRLMGRGACDMLGGVAGLVLAAEDAASRGVPVALALVADEEDRSLGSEAVLAELPRLGLAPRVCLVGEPTGLAPCISLRGYAIAQVRFTGRAGHTSLPHEGVNALSHMARFVTLLDARAERVRGAGGELLASVATAGRAPFTVPDDAVVTVERRTTPGEPHDVILSDIDGVLGELRRAASQVQADVTLQITRPSWELPSHGAARDFADALQEQITVLTGAAADPFAAPYWMEAALWEEAGIPSLVCGPAGGGLHAIDEWVDIPQLRTYTRAVAAGLLTTAAAS